MTGVIRIEKTLKRAVEAGCRSIAFPLISAGIYGYPMQQAWEQAIRACTDFDRENPGMEIIFAVLSDDILAVGEKVLAGSL